MVLFHNMLRQEICFFDDNPIGRLMSSLTEDAMSSQDIFVETVPSLLKATGVLIYATIEMATVSWQITLVGKPPFHPPLPESDLQAVELPSWWLSSTIREATFWPPSQRCGSCCWLRSPPEPLSVLSTSY